MLLTFFVARLKIEGRSRTAELYLKYKATDNTEDLTANEAVLTSFCFPLGPDSVAPKEYMASEEYTFTLTYGDGRRFQGFCRQILPPAPARAGSKLRYPQVMCIISEYPWCHTYFKVLQILEQLLQTGDLLLESNNKDLPPTSMAGAFLHELGKQLSPEPASGQILRIEFSTAAAVGLLGVSPPKLMSMGSIGHSLTWNDEQLELQVPTDAGNGKWNCGISLARLLWHVPVSAMLTLIASMLLERRIILVGQSRDTVTAAVQAASALLYPFKWHHIYLPLLPKTFKDYLTAPMPFMVGLPAQLLPVLRGIPMNEVTIIDLDLGKCDPAPGSERDDSVYLPWREQLEAALTAAYSNLKSPTEYESSPFIAGIMQEYFLKLIGKYRKFIHEQGTQPRHHHHNHQHSTDRLSPAGAPPGVGTAPLPAGHAREPGSRRETSDSHVHAGPSSRDGRHQDGVDTLKGSGYVFEHSAFVASHRHNEKARQLLSMLRHSQLYEVFVQERLKMASTDFEMDEPFEERLERFLERKRARLSQRVRSSTAAVNGQSGSSKWSTMLRKHRRTDSHEDALAGGLRGHMRRITTDPNNLDCKPGGIDPASFFDDDDDDLDELEAELDAARLKSSLASVSITSSVDLHDPDSSKYPFYQNPATGSSSDLTTTSAHLQQHNDVRSSLERASAPIIHAASSSSSSSPSWSIHAGNGIAHVSGDSSISATASTAPSVHGDLSSSGVARRASFSPTSTIGGGSGGSGGDGGGGSSQTQAAVAAGGQPARTGGAAGGLLLSFQQGSKHYEGSFGSVMREAWSDVKKSIHGTVPGELHAGSTAANASEQQVEKSGGSQRSLRDSAGKLMGDLFNFSKGGRPEIGAAGGVPLYVKQTTGDSGKPRLGHRLSQQGAGATLLDGTDGRLKMPPAPARPLSILLQQQQTRQQAGVAAGSGVFGNLAAATVHATAVPAPTATSEEVWDPFGLNTSS